MEEKGGKRCYTVGRTRKNEKNAGPKVAFGLEKSKMGRPEAAFGLCGFSKKKNNHAGLVKMIFLIMVYQKNSGPMGVILNVGCPVGVVQSATRFV